MEASHGQGRGGPGQARVHTLEPAAHLKLNTPSSKKKAVSFCALARQQHSMILI